jgi:hypothetical protein
MREEETNEQMEEVKAMKEKQEYKIVTITVRIEKLCRNCPEGWKWP